MYGENPGTVSLNPSRTFSPFWNEESKPAYLTASGTQYARASYNGRNGWVGINKDPVTDPGKASKQGKLSLYLIDGKYVTTADNSWADNKVEVLRTAYWNGLVYPTGTFDDIRARAARGLDT